MVSKFSRLNESVKAIITMDKRERIMWADLDTVKQEYYTMQKYLGDKVNMNHNRMTEFEVRVQKLEHHCFVNFEKMTKENDRLLQDHKTEMGGKIDDFIKEISDFKNQISNFTRDFHKMNLNQSDQKKMVKKLMDDHHMWKNLNDMREK